MRWQAACFLLACGFVCVASAARGPPHGGFADKLTRSILHSEKIKAAAEAISVALRLQGAQQHAVSAALASAFAAGGAAPAAAAASLAGLLARGHPGSHATLSQAYTSAVLAVLPHNGTAAAAALAEGLTSGDEPLEKGALQALQTVRERGGCPSLLALLQGVQQQAAALPSSADMRRFGAHVDASAAACVAAAS